MSKELKFKSVHADKIENEEEFGLEVFEAECLTLLKQIEQNTRKV